MEQRKSEQPVESADSQQAIVPRGEWLVVGERSAVGFKVRKMGLYDVKGRFRQVKGRIDFPSGAAAPNAELLIDARSISTRMPPRDWHLRTSHFLDVKRHPLIRVRTDRLDANGQHEVTVPATFEIHGASRTATLAAHVHRADAGEEIVLHLTGALDRHDFGIAAPPPFEWIVGREVRLDARLVLARAS